MRILDPHGAALDAQDAVAAVAELEYVAGHAFDGEILVEVPTTRFSGSSSTW